MEHWEEVREQLLAGTCQPKVVLRRELPKRDGGVREIGIPCVLAGGETGPFRCRSEDRGPKHRLKPLQQEVVRLIRELEAESQNGNPG